MPRKLALEKAQRQRPKKQKQLLGENIGKAFSDINLTNVFSGQSPKATEIKAKRDLMGPNQTDKLLHSKENQKENKKTTYRMGENHFK